MSERKPEVVVFTGASAGVGRATAAAFAKRGAQIGPIDIWVNNAMASVFSPVKEMTPQEVGHGAHGQFGARARSSSPEFWLSKNRGWLGCRGLRRPRADVEPEDERLHPLRQSLCSMETRGLRDN